jgi:hypothetical protein
MLHECVIYEYDVFDFQSEVESPTSDAMMIDRAVIKPGLIVMRRSNFQHIGIVLWRRKHPLYMSASDYIGVLWSF